MRRSTALAAIALLAAVAFAETAGGIKWTAPAGWKSLGERPMRAATYVVPAAPGDKEDGECAVFYFGQGQGGGVQANIDRWIGQFDQPDGRPSKGLAKTQQRTINGLRVTTIDLSGTYTGAGGPMGPKVTKPGYRLLGGIVEGPQGAVFFKFTAPAKTVAAQEGAFQKMLGSVTR
jgi:hypothetical protein